MIRSHRIMLAKIEGVAGIRRPADGAFPGGGLKARYPRVAFRWNNAPLRRKVKRAVRSPSFTARFFA